MNAPGRASSSAECVGAPTGLTAAMLGGSVLLASRLALLATVAAVPIAIVRCRREDTALADRHRVAHAEWVAAVGWLWRRRSRPVPEVDRGLMRQPRPGLRP